MLTYIGNGAFLPDVPARDLTEEEVKASGYTAAELIKTGLYTKPAKLAPDKAPHNEA